MIQGFKKAKAVTLPLLKFVTETPLYVKITSQFFKAEKQNGTSAPATGNGTPMKEPPTLAHVVNLETGEEAQIIIGAVLKSEIEKAYPANGYVGKYFEMIQHAVEGKRYKAYSITELSPDDAGMEQGSAPAPAAPAKKGLGRK